MVSFTTAHAAYTKLECILLPFVKMRGLYSIIFDAPSRYPPASITPIQLPSTWRVEEDEKMRHWLSKVHIYTKEVMSEAGVGFHEKLLQTCHDPETCGPYDVVPDYQSSVRVWSRRVIYTLKH